MDFIAFLRDRYVESEQAVGQIQSSLHEEPFIGIWRDNERMSDSSSWVRELRKSEWG
ncbi:MAG: DUF2281 domain-containing protein [Chloroflexi bacterium]|nr:DUF2281 domain-containing protein [Chloroflexota bacterium]